MLQPIMNPGKEFIKMTSHNKKIDRRTFLKTTGLSGASLALSAGLAGSAIAEKIGTDNAPDKSGMPTRILGKTGVPVSILSLGGVDFTSNQLLLRMALKMGVTYWDTAHNYENGKSEIGIGEFFAKYPEERKNVFLVTKASGKDDPEGMSERLQLSLERMKTDYIDCYFIHGAAKPKQLTPEVKAWAEAQKKSGKIKFFGFSTHANMPQMLTHASTLGWIDVIMSTYNYHVMLDDNMKAAVAACAKANIGLVAMKTQGAPLKMIDSSKELSITESFIKQGFTVEQAKLKTVWQDDRISACCSKIKNISMLKDNVAAAADTNKLAGRNLRQLKALSQSTCGLYCRACLKCEIAMGEETRIPDILRYVMYFNSYQETDNARNLFKMLPDQVRRNIASTDYTPAERACPNRIEIGKLMREASVLFT